MSLERWLAANLHGLPCVAPADSDVLVANQKHPKMGVMKARGRGKDWWDLVEDCQRDQTTINIYQELTNHQQKGLSCQQPKLGYRLSTIYRNWTIIKRSATGYSVSGVSFPNFRNGTNPGPPLTLGFTSCLMILSACFWVRARVKSSDPGNQPDHVHLQQKLCSFWSYPRQIAIWCHFLWPRLEM